MRILLSWVTSLHMRYKSLEVFLRLITEHTLKHWSQFTHPFVFFLWMIGLPTIRTPCGNQACIPMITTFIGSIANKSLVTKFVRKLVPLLSLYISFSNTGRKRSFAGDFYFKIGQIQSTPLASLVNVTLNLFSPYCGQLVDD